MNITFKQLKLFVAVARGENVSRGAAVVFLSQPAASMALKELELQVGQPLFDRIGKKLLLNDHGRQLYPKAMALIEQLQLLEQTFKRPNAPLSGTLRIGTSMTIGNYVMPTVIARFMTAHPQVKLIQKVANSETIIHEIEKFALDIGFIESECYAKNLFSHQWGGDDLIVFAAAGHVLAQQVKVSLAELEQAAWVVREPGSGTREALEKCLTLRNIHLEIGSTQAIKYLVQTGPYLGCVSRYALSQEFIEQGLVEIRLPTGVIKRDFLRVMHKDKFHSQLIEAFLAYYP